MSSEPAGPGTPGGPIIRPETELDPQGAQHGPMLPASGQFDPDASPQEKAAQLKAQLPDSVISPKKNSPAHLASDIDGGAGPKVDLPPPTKAGVTDVPADDPSTDGVDVTKEIWKRVGGPPRFGMQKLEPEEADRSLLDEQTALEGMIKDKFYGGVLGGGVGWLIIIFAFCATYYRTSIRRVRRNARDDIQREMAMTKLETDAETIEWINSFLLKFWPIYSPVVCATIVNTVDQVLSTTKPAVLDDLRIKTFTLGSKPPRMELVRISPKDGDDYITMDWKFSFTPNDTADMTYRQLKVKTNPKIVLEARIGKGVVSKGMDVIVEDMSCVGHIRLKIKFQLAFPHIERVEMCFLEPPQFDYVCKPIGGDMFGMDVNIIPGLSTFIAEIIHGILRPMMYDPNVFPIEVAKMLAGNPVDQAIGVVSITLHGAEGLKGGDRFGSTLDPYAVVSINNRTSLGRTNHIPENPNPKWNKTINILVSSLSDTLTIPIFDYNGIRRDKEIGLATFPLDKLQESDEFENQHLPVLSNGKPRGLVHCDIRYFPVLEETKLPDGTVQPPPESNTGILRFTVEQAKDLDASKSLVGRLNPYAVLLLNGEEVKVSQKLKRTNQPVFPDAFKELLITNRSTAKLGVMIKDDRDLATDPVVGSYQIKVDDILDLMSKGQDWYNLAGVPTGRVKMTAQWRPVALRGAIAGAGAYVTPIGVMRIHIKNARDLRNLETLGKSDPYTRICLSGVQKARTVTFQNNLDPDWNEVFYISVHSTREVVTLEVMDEETVGSDRSLGMTEVAVSNWAKKDEDGNFVVTEPVKVERALKTNSRDPGKGALHFSVAFYPIIPVADPEDESEKKGEEGEKRKSEDVTPSDSASTGASASHKSDGSDYVVLPPGAPGSSAGPDRGVSRDGEVKDSKKPLVRLTPESLQNYESGLLIFRLIDGQIARSNCHLQLLVDDSLFPAYTSGKIKSHHHTFNETGDVMIRELEFSQISLRLVDSIDHKGENNQKEVLAKVTGSTLATLQRGLYAPTTIDLQDSEGRLSKINVLLKYIPIKIRLPPRDSFNNQGVLRVHVKKGTDLPAADRNGYSDPFCKFFLNNSKVPVFKTDKVKKTLNPEWNESFEVDIRSRVDDTLRVDVFDWDFGDKDDFLGSAVLSLENITPFNNQTVKLPLDRTSGEIELDLVFRPSFITRSRLGSSTFHGKTFVAPVSAVASGVKGVGMLGVEGAAKGAGMGFRGIRGVGSRMANLVRPKTQSEFPDMPSTEQFEPQSVRNSMAGESLSPTHGRQRSIPSSVASQPGLSPPNGSVGTITMSVLGMTNAPTETSIEVSILMLNPGGKNKRLLSLKGKTDKEGSYTFEQGEHTLSASGASQFKLVVSVHHKLKPDEIIGETVFMIPDQGSQPSEQTVVASPVNVRMRTNFAYPLEEGGLNTPNKRRPSMLGRSPRTE